MEIYELARPHMKLGMSGKDVQALFQNIVKEKSFGYSWQKEYNPYVSIGIRSSYNCKMPPSDVYIMPGDLVNVDFGITVDGFASDNQRSFYAPDVGETAPPEEVRRAFLTMQSVNTAVCAAMKTGIDSRSLADVGNKVMNEYGYDGKKFGGYGHEICIYAHNGGIGAGESAVNNFMDTILEENMTFTLEPAIITSHGRLCQEEVVCVKKDGGIMLSTPQKEIWSIYEV
jgi:Xaa-Pro aminopeptidase